ncbi:sulfatase-like hydrolase/transferase [Amphritea sp. HPY]|uniref:sulfatase-like hydrolase/transferase n=1 Tax=Amphritea sp. HPY TaxID=3421652 RepID=UPI003D7DFE7D
MTSESSLPAQITVKRTFWRTAFLMLLSIGLLLYYRQILQFYTPLAIADTITHIKQEHLLNTALILDIVYFIVVVISLHLFWVMLITISCIPWIKSNYSDNTKTLIWLTIFTTHLTLSLALNSILYPTSLLAFLRDTLLDSWAAVILLAIPSGLLLLHALWQLIGRFTTSVLFTILTAGILTGLNSYPGYQEKQQSPNIIIIGIDGLRPDHLAHRGMTPQLAPGLNSFLSNSIIFDKTYTPMARTYVAWMSLLKGQYPVTHEARFNLTDPDIVDKKFPLLQQLKNKNYRTLYAMDERRFNHIDEEYGFDRVIGPKLGAADAIITHSADLPLVNLLVNTSLSEYLMPFLNLNRAYGKAYNPENFNQRVISSMATDRPNFVAVHFCMLHWPYTSREFIADLPVPWQGNYNHYMYQAMLPKMDAQFSAFMDQLKRSGQLDNALVYVFSDHGEGFNLPRDQLTTSSTEPTELQVNAWGHGTNILNQPQSEVLLAFNRFQDGEPAIAPAIVDGLYSLIDIAPTLFSQLGLSNPAHAFDGEALHPETVPNMSNGDRLVFTESSIPVKAINTSFIDEKKVVSETASKYEINSLGRPQLKTELYPELLEKKQRAVYSDNWQLAILPDQQQPVLVNTQSLQLHQLSDYKGDAPWQVMLRALCEHYQDDPGFDEHGYCKQVETMAHSRY